MTKGEEIKVELTALSELRHQLLKTKEGLDEPIQQAREAAKAELNRLEHVKTQREQEVDSCERNLAACEAALQSCLSYVDEDGRRPPCTAEAAALRQAEQALRHARQALSEAIAHIANFQSQTDQMLSKLTSEKEVIKASIESASQYLYDHIMKTIEYLKGQDIAIPPTLGQKSHGSEYQNARNRFFREGAAGDFPNTPTYLRGWMEQEVERGGYYRSPGGWRGYRNANGDFEGGNPRATHHVGHILRNLNIPENFRWELALDNQHRIGWRGIANNY